MGLAGARDAKARDDPKAAPGGWLRSAVGGEPAGSDLAQIFDGIC